LHKKQGCFKCSNELKTDIKKLLFLKKAKKTHGNKYNYKNLVYKNSQTKVNIICKIHGEFLQTPGCHLAGKGCPECSLSKGENRVVKFFKSKKIKFKIQKTFKKCRDKGRLFYDFYVSKYKLLVEFDGKQHFEPIEYFGGLKSFKERKRRDRIKTKWAKQNGYKLLRIKYTKLKRIDTVLDNYFKKLEHAKF
jgi:very-short-patch-repair endonuclease